MPLSIPAVQNALQEDGLDAWLLYDLQFDPGLQRCRLERAEPKYTQFKPSLDTITNPEPGNVAR